MAYYLVFISCVFVCTIGAGLLYFRSVWIRQGYEGRNKILELFEVKSFYIHVIGFLFVLVVEGMIFLPPVVDYSFPTAVWLFVGGIFSGVLGSEIFVDLKKSMNKLSGIADKH